MSTTKFEIPSEPTVPVSTITAKRARSINILRINATLLTGLSLATLALLVAILGPMLAGADASEQSLVDKLTAPGEKGFLLGSDLLGRDILARISQGFWWSLPVGIAAATLATVIGAILGLIAGWSQGLGRRVIVQLVDVGVAFPYMVLAILLVAVMGRGFWPMVLALGLIAWVSTTKIVYAEVLSVSSRQYVLTAKLQGAPIPWILGTYVFRAVRSRIIVSYAFMFANLLVAEASLSFLGLGAPIGLASWGSMLRDSREYLTEAPWLLYAPGGMVVLVVLAANLIGDGLIKQFSISSPEEVTIGG